MNAIIVVLHCKSNLVMIYLKLQEKCILCFFEIQNGDDEQFSEIEVNIFSWIGWIG